MLKPCPFCGTKAEATVKSVDTGGAICRRVYGVQCSNNECFVRPKVFVEGECGYKHLDKHTNKEAERLSIERWEKRK